MNEFLAQQKVAKLIELKRFDTALELCKDHIGKNDYLDKHFYNQMSYCYFRLNELENAEKSVNIAIEKDPNNPLSYMLLSYLNRDRGFDDLALEYASKALELSPNDVNCKINIAECLLIVNNYNSCLELLESIEEVDPQNEQVLYLKCLLYLYTKDMAQFNKYINHSLSIYPNDPRFLALKGERHLRDEDYEKAITYAKKSLEIDPTNSNTQGVLKKAEYGLKEVVPIGIGLILLIKIILILLRIGIN